MKRISIKKQEFSKYEWFKICPICNTKNKLNADKCKKCNFNISQIKIH